MTRKTPEQLRSFRTWGAADLRSFGHRSRTKQMGYAEVDWKGKPVIGILNTWSDLNQCHQHFRIRAEEVKRGVWQAGGFPVEIPALALPEQYMKPTSMFYRNLLAIEVEEIARGQPLDGLVLMGGCDKTTPAMLMGAISANLPAIFMPAGPMLSGNWNGNKLGSGSDTWKYWDELRAGNITQNDWQEIENGIARSWGTCMTMGTASTMTVSVEAMGFSLPGASAIPAPDSNHARMASACGRRIVDMVWDDLTPKAMLTAGSFDNAVRVRDGPRRLHQLHRPPDRHGPPRRRRPGPRPVRRTQPHLPPDRQHPPLRKIPHGGLLLRRRIARPDGGLGRPARSLRRHRHR